MLTAAERNTSSAGNDDAPATAATALKEILELEGLFPDHFLPLHVVFLSIYLPIYSLITHFLPLPTFSCLDRD